MLAGSAQRVGLMLSVVVAVMVACFGGALSGTGVPRTLLFGLVPRIPDGAAEVALGLMGTTAIPVNLLLGSSLAKESSLPSMRRGVGLASLLRARRPGPDAVDRLAEAPALALTAIAAASAPNSNSPLENSL